MSTSAKLIFINTAPKVNSKKDGTQFFTCLVGVSKAILDEKNASQAQKLTMTIFENQLDAVTKAFNLAKRNGLKLALACDDVVITEPKMNSYINRDGEQVEEFQASIWADGPSELTIVKSTMSISDELRKLLGDDDGGDDVLV
jgi:hypothetical protein